MHDELFPAWPTLIAYIGACLVLLLTPGPGVIYIVTRSLAQGRRAGLASVAGVAMGNIGNAIGASVGLAALFAVSELAFLVVKYAGAAYLIYLGVNALRRSSDPATPVTVAAASPRKLFRDGFLVALLNPKTTLFFSAFLPQFLDTHGSTIRQALALSLLCVMMGAVTDSLYAITASYIAPALARARQRFSIGRYVTGGVFIGLGLFAATSGSRAAK